ncbi:MAG: rRNA pseudouridine synthase [Candidatus Saganbacteria bacterium]|nr:rRNA pseudouridine synthase [Candidatus Saganbacteria bacterium]
MPPARKLPHPLTRNLPPSPRGRGERQVRLQKFLADCGITSRRKAEELIAAGKVSVNGKIVDRLGTKIDPAEDKVEAEGKPVRPGPKKIYLKLNKPRGVVSSCVSQRGEPTICDLIKGGDERLYPVGRLDQASEGLMLLTNDGELANRLMHPRYEHEKEYIVNVECRMPNDALRSLSSGIVIDGKKTLPAKVKRLGEKSFSIVLQEGRKRQIRLMVEAVGNKVVALKRVRIKNLRLGDLKPGQHRPLTAEEIKDLRS